MTEFDLIVGRLVDAIAKGRDGVQNVNNDLEIVVPATHEAC